MRKTRIAYWVIVYRHIGEPHKQYIQSQELHLIATWLKDTETFSHAEIYREELPHDHWMFT